MKAQCHKRPDDTHRMLLDTLPNRVIAFTSSLPIEVLRPGPRRSSFAEALLALGRRLGPLALAVEVGVRFGALLECRWALPRIEAGETPARWRRKHPLVALCHLLLLGFRSGRHACLTLSEQLSRTLFRRSGRIDKVRQLRSHLVV